MGIRTLLSAFVFSALAAAALHAQSTRGVVRGTVFVRGEAHALRVPVSQHQDVCGESVQNRHVMVEGGRLANALVVLDYKGQADMPSTPVILETTGCDFQPTVQVAPPGATLILRNGDPISHRMLLERGGSNLTTVEVAASGEKKQRGLLDEPKLLDIRCEAHEWMHAKIWVLNHPYYAWTWSDGSFEIPLIPEGTYTLKVWHEQFGVLAQEIIVRADGSVTANFTYAQ